MAAVVPYRLGVQSTDAINLVEVVLRDLIREVIGLEWQTVIGLDLSRLEAGRKNEMGRRRGAIVSTDLLDYADFVVLQIVVDAKWNAFKPVLKNSKHFKLYMDRLGAFRNTSMHSRELLPFEESLTIGMTGEIRNLVTIWRSEQGPDMKYYPEIISVSDSLGSRLVNGRASTTALRPGETIEFKCAGTDPHGRNLFWEIRVQSRGNSMVQEDARKGDEVTLTWNVVNNHVRENTDVWVTVTSDGEYHRHGEFDDRFHLSYRVLPPVIGQASAESSDQ